MKIVWKSRVCVCSLRSLNHCESSETRLSFKVVRESSSSFKMRQQVLPGRAACLPAYLLAAIALLAQVDKILPLVAGVARNQRKSCLSWSLSSLEGITWPPSLKRKWQQQNQVSPRLLFGWRGNLTDMFPNVSSCEHRRYHLSSNSRQQRCSIISWEISSFKC